METFRWKPGKSLSGEFSGGNLASLCLIRHIRRQQLKRAGIQRQQLKRAGRGNKDRRGTKQDDIDDGIVHNLRVIFKSTKVSVSTKGKRQKQNDVSKQNDDVVSI